MNKTRSNDGQFKQQVKMLLGQFCLKWEPSSLVLLVKIYAKNQFKPGVMPGFF